MPDPKDSRPPFPSAGGSPPAAPAPTSGKVVHDERGNAVWDWLKETSRIAIESTSRLLRRLDVNDLKVEGEKDTELRIEGEGDSGGGYDPYNQARGKRTPRR
jgi:hypothetical protein